MLHQIHNLSVLLNYRPFYRFSPAPQPELTESVCPHFPTESVSLLSDFLENTAVKDAVCAVADVYYSCKKKQEAGTVKSESNDGYSVSYAVEQADGQTMEELIRKKAYEAASTYLLPTGWLSRKVKRDGSKR